MKVGIKFSLGVSSQREFMPTTLIKGTYSNSVSIILENRQVGIKSSLDVATVHKGRFMLSLNSNIIGIHPIGTMNIITCSDIILCKL